MGNSAELISNWVEFGGVRAVRELPLHYYPTRFSPSRIASFMTDW